MISTKRKDSVLNPVVLCEYCHTRVARKIRVNGFWRWFCTHCWK